MKTYSFMITAMILMSAGATYGQDQIEKEKIQHLINSVEKMEGASFIRNGSEHSGTEAANHLRMKLEKAGDRIKTA